MPTHATPGLHPKPTVITRNCKNFTASVSCVMAILTPNIIAGCSTVILADIMAIHGESARRVPIAMAANSQTRAAAYPRRQQALHQVLARPTDPGGLTTLLPRLHRLSRPPPGAVHEEHGQY
jgi:hypothetical protein